MNKSGKTVVKGYYGLLYRGIFLNDFTAAIPSVAPKYYFDITSTGARTGFEVVSSNNNLTIDHGYMHAAHPTYRRNDLSVTRIGFINEEFDTVQRREAPRQPVSPRLRSSPRAGG